MEKSDFRVMVRRVPGYEPTVSLRFEMHEGYGELHVGERRRASPSALGEVAEVTGETVRGGRFVHVLASGRRRQSYAFSRLDDDRLQRLPDDKWIELGPVTEFGIRYLDLPAMDSGASVAAIQVSAPPAPTRTATPTPAQASGESSLLARVRSRASRSGSTVPTAAAAPTAGARATASPTPPRAASAPSTSSSNPAVARAAAPRAAAASPQVTTRSPPPARTSSPAPSGAATHSAVARGVAVESTLGHEAVARLPEAEIRLRLMAEMAKVEQLHQALAEAETRLAQSLAREADLVAVIQRWSERG